MPIPRPLRHFARLVNAVAGIAGRSCARELVQTVKNRRDAAILTGLDDRMLADIGLTRGDLRDAYSEPVWRDPTAILVNRAQERRVNRRARPGSRRRFSKRLRSSRRRRSTRSARRWAPVTTELGRADPPPSAQPLRTSSSPLRSGTRARRPLRRALFISLVRPARPIRSLSRPSRRRTAGPPRQSRPPRGGRAPDAPRASRSP